MNGADEGEEKPKKAAPPKKASAAEKKAPAKKVSTAPASAKKRAQKKVSFLFLSYLSSVPHTLQDAEESGEDFADEIDDVPAEEDEPPEADNKKRKVCLTIFDMASTFPSHHASAISVPRRRPSPLNLRRRKRNRLLVVPRRLKRQMRRRKTEFVSLL